MYFKIFHNQKGQIALLITLVILGAILSIGAGLTLVTIKEMRMSKTTVESIQAFFVADSGMEYALHETYKRGGTPPTGTCDNIGEGEYCLDTDEGIESIGTVKGKRRTVRIINNWAKVYGGTGDDEISEAFRIPGGGYSLLMDTTSYGPHAAAGDFVIVDIDADGTPELGKAFGGNNRETIYEAVSHRLPSGGYIITGKTKSYGNGDYDIFVLKLDANKDPLWQKTFGGPDFEETLDIKLTPAASNGGCILWGGTKSYGAGDEDTLVIKLDDNGNQEWAYTFGGVNCDRGGSMDLAGSGYILMGDTESYGEGYKDLFLIKLNSNGILQWAKTFGYSNRSEYCASNITTSDGGQIMSTYDMYNRVGGSFRKMCGTLIKLDSSGDQEWVTRCFSPGGWGGLGGPEKALDGGYFSVGSYYVGGGKWHGFFVKFDDNGNEQWTKYFAGGGSDSFSNLSENYTLDRGYFMVGNTTSWGAGGKDGIFLKMSKDGLIYDCPPFTSAAAPICSSVGAVPTHDITGDIIVTPLVVDETNFTFDIEDDVVIDSSNVCTGAGAKWIEIR
ncbi:pilus assembly PilX N-terminal domain-containing protein [Candidatus Parcubacteria bacterium]|nr:pilus assembly PilX N-terminal domain-containing protein [Candidatus Parcubacteria bacterium]